MSELFSIQLQNRQQQGRDGVWLDLPTTTEQVQAALRQIGISSDNPQGLFISGYFAEEEKRFAIPYNMVLASSVDELNFLAARLETLSTGERAELNAALQAPQSELFSIGRITDFPENVDYYVHLPDVPVADIQEFQYQREHWCSCSELYHRRFNRRCSADF